MEMNISTFSPQKFPSNKWNQRFSQSRSHSYHKREEEGQENIPYPNRAKIQYPLLYYQVTN
jgi:hypothetical protein